MKRIALNRNQLDDLPSFPASDKKKDPRHKWFVRNYGRRCWELDAMDPNDLRALVRKAIRDKIEPVAWTRCATVEKAEREFDAARSRTVEERAMMRNIAGGVMPILRASQRLNIHS